MNKNCEHCGGQFVAKRPHRKFCSTSCRDKKYRDENKPAIAAYRKKYRQENKATAAASQKKYRDKNKPAKAAYNKKYQQEKKAAIRAYLEKNKTAVAARKKKYNEKKRNQQLAHRPNRHCLNCHSTIPITARSHKKFCSLKCQYTYRRHKDTTGDAAFFELIAATHALSETLTNN